jgi:DNA-binding beta-propeller fold protein YncE
MPRPDRPTPGLALPMAALVLVAISVATVAACSDDDGGDDADEVGTLQPVAESDDLAEAIDVAAGDGLVWVATDAGQVLQVSGDGLAEAEGLDAVSTVAGIAASDDGTLFATDPDRRSLMRYRDGSVDDGAVPPVQELSALAAAADGTVYVADHDALQVVSIGADGRVGELADDALAGPLTVAPDGTVYYVDDQVLDGRIMTLPPGGGPEALTQSVERDDEGNPVEAPSDGASAGDSYIEARDLAATDDGVFVLTFTNEVWRVGNDGDLELVLRRGGDSALVALGASGDDVYVLDAGTGTLSTIDAAG